MYDLVEQEKSNTFCKSESYYSYVIPKRNHLQQDQKAGVEKVKEFARSRKLSINCPQVLFNFKTGFVSVGTVICNIKIHISTCF